MISIRIETANGQATTLQPRDIKLDAAKLVLETDEQNSKFFLELQNLFILRTSADFIDIPIVWRAEVSIPSLGATFRGFIGLEDRQLVDNDYYSVTIRLDAEDYIARYLRSAIVGVDELGHLVRKVPVNFEGDQLTVQRITADLIGQSTNLLHSIVANLQTRVEGGYTRLEHIAGDSALAFATSPASSGASTGLTAGAYRVSQSKRGFLWGINNSYAGAMLTQGYLFLSYIRIATKFLKNRKTQNFNAVSAYDLLTFTLDRLNINYNPQKIAFLQKYYIVTPRNYFKVSPLIDLIIAFNRIVFLTAYNNQFFFSVETLQNAVRTPRAYGKYTKRESFDFVAYKSVEFERQQTNIWTIKEEYNFDPTFNYFANSYQRLIEPALGSRTINVELALAKRKATRTIFDKFVIVQAIAAVLTIAQAITVIVVTIRTLERLNAILAGVQIAIGPALFDAFRTELQWLFAESLTSLVLSAFMSIMLVTLITMILAYRANEKLISIENLNTTDLIAIFEDLNKGILKKDSHLEILTDIQNANFPVYSKIIYEEEQTPLSSTEFFQILQNPVGIKYMEYNFRDEWAKIQRYELVPTPTQYYNFINRFS